MTQKRGTAQAVVRERKLAVIQIIVSGLLSAAVLGILLVHMFSEALFEDQYAGYAGFATFIVFGFLGNGINRLRINTRFKQYARALAKDPDRSVKTLAQLVNQPLQLVYRQIQQMMSRGYFPGSFLDAGYLRPIVHAGDARQGAQPQGDKAYLICRACGAGNHVSASDCEFCGSLLQR